MTTQVTVLKGNQFPDEDRITRKIRAKASTLSLMVPNAEIACLIRERFTDAEIEDMRLWRIIVMHEPIDVSGGGPSLLAARRDGGGRWLGACGDHPDHRWNRDYGFAFASQQVS